MLKKILIGNWKMNPLKEDEALMLAKKVDLKDVVIAPPAVFLSSVGKKIKRAKLAAQDAFWDMSGAYTGENSATMMKNLGVKYVILGHSERRELGETDELVSRKVKSVLKEKMTPILCIGEKVRDHEMFYLNSVKSQLLEGFKYISRADLKKIIVAYEPVWAIGKKAEREASPEECLEMVIFIKKVLSDKYGAKAASDVRIVYGGSVNPKNIDEFLSIDGLGGFLVGRASLDPDKFYEIYKTTQKS